MKMKNFEPFIDWSKITQEDADKITDNLLVQARLAQELFRDTAPENCALFIESKMVGSDFLRDLVDSVWTFPAMVHVAGEWGLETNPDNDKQKAVIQRCSNCKSIINYWHEGTISFDEAGLVSIPEEDNDWWEIGSQVAKRQDENTFYEIKGRELEEHEVRCLGADIFKDM